MSQWRDLTMTTSLTTRKFCEQITRQKLAELSHISSVQIWQAQISIS